MGEARGKRPRRGQEGENPRAVREDGETRAETGGLDKSRNKALSF